MKKEQPQKKKNGRYWILGICIIIIIGISILWPLFKSWAKRWNVGGSAALLAAAVTIYQDQYDELPENLETILKTGFFGIDQRYNIQNGQIRISDQPVKYLKATEPGFIIAVFDEMDGEVYYVISGDTSSHLTDKEGIIKILQKDNELRKKNWPTHRMEIVL